MELILAVAIGVLAGSGIWLLLRPRTFQVIIGLSLLSYAVNLFIFATGRLRIGAAPIVDPAKVTNPANFSDPLPQALVLTAIVIGFAMTALFLVVLLTARGLTGTDHVDGRERGPMNIWTADHLIVAPIILPLVTAAILLLFDESRRELKAILTFATTLALLAISIILLLQSNTFSPEGGNPRIGVYPLGNWPAPFGIVLVIDRLSALMLVLTSILANTALLFSFARWHQAGPRFHALFLFLLMGLNGAFLTGDLFNLFVFFEVLLSASYALALHGAGNERVRASLHYIAVNLTASMLFLIGVSLIYAVTGTLNMADLAIRIPAVEPDDRVLLESGAAILGVAFLVKAGMWPLNFWLPTTYAAASAPVAAMFAIMTKVGVYAILRLSLLLFGTGAGPSVGFGTDWLFYGGIATLTFGIIGVLASQTMPRLAGYSIIVTSGTLLAAIGTGTSAVVGAALFYVVISTLATAAFFLLIELIERARNPGADLIAVTMEAFGDEEEKPDSTEEIGIAIPATIAVLGTGFVISALLLAGLPPLSGFIAKFALISALLNAATTISTATWLFITLILISSLAAMIATTRTGITTFWAPVDETIPRVRVIEILPIGVLLALCFALTVIGDPALRYLTATARTLVRPVDYKTRVMTPPRTERLPEVTVR